MTLIQQVTERVRGEGGRMTGQRRLILEALENLSGHPTAEEIYARVRKEDAEINLSTVYRTLRWLEESGFVAPRWFEDDHRRERFDAAGSSDDHFHFRCRTCNQIIEFDDPNLEIVKQAFETQYLAEVENITLVLYGLCARCKIQPNQAQGA
ncbi:MAG: transcriptional repressor [Anaerolineae bacterium]|nr:transcriptional repressor [Anaerolineae bacterium]